MNKKILTPIVAILLSGIAFAAGAGEAAGAEAAGAERGLSLGDGAQLVALGAIVSLVLMAGLYYFLSKKN
jgi:hypothetical protein